MKRGLLVFLLTFYSLIIISQGGLGSHDISHVPSLDLPKLNNDILIAKELEARKTTGRAPEFAKACNVDEGCHQSGEWTIAGGKAIWKLRIKSEGAESLNFGFSEFYLPTSASFYMTGVSSGQRRGPFISADNDSHDQFWSPIIEDEEVLLELEVDLDQRDHVRLKLAKVNHGFFKLGSKNFSGSCNLDVVCSTSDGWGINEDYRDIIRSVIMYSLNGTRACTGMLINNIRENGTPYIITADHCGVTSNNAPSLVAYFNYENSFCRQPNSSASGQNGDGALLTFNTGASWISATAVGAGTDFNLLELDDAINPAANAFISGWSRENVAPSSAIAIHHPSTQEKRISYENDGLQITDNGGTSENLEGKYLRIGDWDTGTTEPGSSGSPLFNPDKRFIGQLFGGDAACGNNASDYYGRLAVSWEGGGSPTTRTKEYLDPDGVALEFMNGVEANSTFYHSVPDSYFKKICAPSPLNFSITTNNNFSSNVIYSVVDNPSGIQVNFSTTVANPGEAVDISIPNTSGVATGVYALRIRTEDGSGNFAETPLWIEIQTQLPGMISTISPLDNQEYLIPTPILKWEENNEDSIFDIEVASDATFTNVVAAVNGLEESPWVISEVLDPNTSYFWRIRGETACEVGEWSDTLQFTIGDDPICNTSESTDVPVTINIPTAGTVISELVVTDVGKISEINVSKIKGLHTWISDLSFTLISPSGTEALLLANLCESEDNFDIGFSDESDNLTVPCPYNTGTIVLPAEPLSIFLDERAIGTWKLRIEDGADEDGGQLDEWALEICTVDDPSVFLTTAEDNLQSCGDINTSIRYTVGNGFVSDVSLNIVSTISGITTTLSQTTVSPGETVDLTIEGSISGNETITLQATDGTTAINKDFFLEYQPGTEAPLLSMPLDQATNLHPEMILNWNSSANTDEYIYQVSLSSDFSSLELQGNTMDTLIDASLLYLTEYYWRVFSVNECDTTVSEIRSFSTESQFVFAPINDSIRTCASQVEYEIELISGFSGNVSAAISGEPDQSIVEYFNNDGQAGDTIVIRISNIPQLSRSYDLALNLVDDNGGRTANLKLIIDVAPTVPTLVTPENNTIEIDTLPTFDFETDYPSSGFQVEISTDLAFTDPLILEDDCSICSIQAATPLTPNTTYFWRVVSENSCGISFSPIYQFMTEVRTDIDEPFEAESIELVPNPTRNTAEIVIESATLIRGGYQIYSINGQQLMSGELTSSRTQLPTTELAKGIYLVRIQDDNAFIVKKLIIF